MASDRGNLVPIWIRECEVVTLLENFVRQTHRPGSASELANRWVWLWRIERGVPNSGCPSPRLLSRTTTFRNLVTFLIDKELAAKPFDAVIMAVPQMEALEKTGQLQTGSRAAISRVGVGVVVRAGAPIPDVSTPGPSSRP